MASEKHMTRAFAARAKDRSILEKSASGGMFTVLTDLFLENGDAVVGCVFDPESKTAQLKLITAVDQRDLARGSKYMSGNIGTVYQDCVQWLRQNPGQNLLFTGLGCQAAAFLKIAERLGLTDRVLVVDLICHGVPSGKLWAEYISDLENKHHTTLQSVNFRDKRTGWAQSQPIAYFSDREINMNDYMRIFYDNLILRPSCYHCPYASVERNSDMTIGDFWGIGKSMPDFVDPMGNSLVLLHSKKGIALFERIADRIDFRECQITDCLQPNLIHPTQRPENRDAFWRDYNRRGAPYVVDKYGHITFFKRVTRKLRKILRRIFG